MNVLEEAREIISECEEYQESQDSDYRKRMEKVSAYERLKELLNA